MLPMGKPGNRSGGGLPPSVPAKNKKALFTAHAICVPVYRGVGCISRRMVFTLPVHPALCVYGGVCLFPAIRSVFGGCGKIENEGEGQREGSDGMGQCSNCWWLSDKRTGICCNEKSEYNLCFVNMDNVCERWSARDGSSREDRPEWRPRYQEGDDDRE